jgi:hypothetical protein
MARGESLPVDDRVGSTPMSQIDELRESIDARIVEIQNEIAVLQAARQALRDGSATTSSGVTVKSARPTRHRGARRAARNGADAESSAGAGDGAAAGSDSALSPAAALQIATERTPARRRARTRKAVSADSARDDGDGATPAAPARTESQPAAAAKPRGRARRKPVSSGRRVELLLAGGLESILAESAAGLSAIAISKRSHASYKQVLDLLRELEQTGRVRRSGTSRASRWRVVSDEERIAERAAELQRLSVRTSER